jgi:predicted dehydrogenase
MEHLVSRREFMQASAVATTAASFSRLAGANERIRLGLIGCGGRGTYLLRRLNVLGGIQWVAICDIWDQRRDKLAPMAGPEVKKYHDYRELLEHKDIDAVVIASPDHWHAQMTTDAARAGKDMYVEKPMTSTPDQGPKVVKAVRDSKRILAVGVQQRSGVHYIEAKEKIIDTGQLGQIGLVRTWYDANNGYTFTPPPGMEKKPEGLDWERYLGWLPKIPWDPKRYFNHFAYWDISTGGQTGGLFVHLVDTVHWFLGLEKPSAAVAGGGIYHYNDGRDTPDVINLIVEYPQKLNVTFEAEILTAPMRWAAEAAMEFRGTGGVLTVYRYPKEFGWVFTRKSESRTPEVITGKGYAADADPHLKHWLACVREQKRTSADEVSGHYSVMPCHMGNLAYRRRGRVEWDKKWDV